MKHVEKKNREDGGRGRMRPRKAAAAAAQESKQRYHQQQLIACCSRKKRGAAPSQCLPSPSCKRSKAAAAQVQQCRSILIQSPHQHKDEEEEEERDCTARQSLLGTIFSPVLHLLKGLGGECSSTCTAATADQAGEREEVDGGGGGVGDQTTVEVVKAEEEQEQEEDYFDPYLFIKNLPELSQIVPRCRRLLLPRQTRRCPPITLVLDLDETLVHSTLDECPGADFSFPVQFNLQKHMVYVRQRPHLQMFMERVAQLFEIIIFTASQSIYAEQLLNILDPRRRIFRHRVFRDSCLFVAGNYLKDLTVLGRDLSKTVIVDNSPQAFGFQVDNGIPIESWFDDQADCELASLLPFLESLATVEDVRPIIAKTYRLRQKIEAATEPPSKQALLQLAVS